MMYLKQVYQIHYWIQILSIPLPTQFFFISYLASPNSNLHNRKTQSNLSNVNYWNLTWRSIMLHFSGLQLYWRDSNTAVFRWNLWNFQEHLFSKNTPGCCFYQGLLGNAKNTYGNGVHTGKVHRQTQNL